MPNPPRSTVEAAVAALRPRLGLQPRVVFVLGTGHEALAAHLTHAVSLAGPTLPDGVAFAHGAAVWAGHLRGVPVLLTGACPPYHEGPPEHVATRLALPLRVLRRLGADTLVLTAGVASLGETPPVGAIAVVEDHLDLSATHVLRIAPDLELGPRFLDQSEPYSRRLRDLATDAARDLGFVCPDAVLAALPGPVLPTRAESRALRALGADLAGMSLVPEAIVGRHAGFEVLALAAVTQRLDAGATSVPALLRTVDDVAPRLTQLLLACTHALGSQTPA